MADRELRLLPGDEDTVVIAGAGDTLAVSMNAARTRVRVKAVHPTTPPVDPPPVEPPPVEPPPVSTGMYGPGIAADTQRNHRTAEFDPVSYVFDSPETKTLTGFRYYMEAQGDYGSGDGGSRVITLTDDTGKVLMSGSHSGRPAAGSPDRFQTVSGSAPLVKGKVYTIKWRNSGAGDVSINAHFIWHAEDPDQLRYPDWKVYRAGVLQSEDIPILQLLWSDGRVSGNGYYGTSQKAPNQAAIGGLARVRETFTPRTDVTFTEIWVRLKRDPAANTSPLTVALAGVGGTIPASAFPVGSQVDAPGNRNGWAKLVVPSSTLRAGVVQHLELAAMAGQTFRAQGLGKNGWGFKDPFPDGKGERSTDGGVTWGPLPWYDGTNANQDIQWCLR